MWPTHLTSPKALNCCQSGAVITRKHRSIQGDGLDLIRQIISLAVDLLTPQGWLVIEHGEDQGQAVRQLFEQHGLTEVRTIVDQSVSDSTGSSVMSVGRWSTDFLNKGSWGNGYGYRAGLDDNPS